MAILHDILVPRKVWTILEGNVCVWIACYGVLVQLPFWFLLDPLSGICLFIYTCLICCADLFIVKVSLFGAEAPGDSCKVLAELWTFKEQVDFEFRTQQYVHLGHASSETISAKRSSN